MAPRCCCWTNVMIMMTGFVLSTSTAQDMTRQEQEQYLTTFAYLSDVNPDPQMQALREDPERQFVLAVRTFQHYAGLNETGVVDDATVQMMRMPRCGVSDTLTMSSVARRRKRYTASRNKWDKLHLTYRFLGYTRDLPQDTVRRVFVKAFQMWSQVSALTFSETTDLSDIEIDFAAREHGDGNAFDGPGKVLAHAYFPGRGIGGDAHFDEDETWTDMSYQGTNLLQVAIHEIGHSLGLGHSDVQSAIMAPFYRGYKPNVALDQDDINGIRYLYGQGGPGGRPTTIGPPTSTTPRYGPPTTLPPDYCPLAGFCRDFDAIDVIGDTIYVFKGEFYARLSRYAAIVDIQRIQNTWPELPTPLDAVMSTRSFVYFFKGSAYWRMVNTALGPEGNSLSRRLLRVGFPGAPSNMDAAFVWSGNGRIYFIKGGLYWRYSGYSVDRGYPLTLNYWTNVRRPVNDVFQYRGVTYFFSGRYYQVFDDQQFAAGQPRSTNDLMQCCTRQQEQLAHYISSVPTLSHSRLGLTFLLISAMSALL